MHMKILWTSAIATSVFFTGAISVNAFGITTLYDGSLSQTPDTQNAAIRSGAICAASSPFGPCATGGAFPFQVSTSQTVVTGGVQLNTAANSAEYSGYSNYQPANPLTMKPASYFGSFNANTLDQTTGYSITFTVQIDPSSSNNTTGTNPRAPFSIIAVSKDITKAIEIGFRVNEIFAQSSSNFTSQDPLQTKAFNTTANPTTYKLTVLNSGYTLTNETSSTLVISGNLVDYSSFVSTTPPLPFNPYATQSFVFLGDDTSKESGTFTLGTVQLDTTPVPFDFSPNNGLAVVLGAITGLKYWRNKVKDKQSK